MKILRNVVTVICGALLACSPSSAMYVPAMPMSSSAWSKDGADLTVMTFNVGIAPGVVTYATPRIPHAAKAVAAMDADVTCIQEAWTKESVVAIRASMDVPASGFFHVETFGEGEDAADTCDEGDLDGILECAKEHCAGIPDEELTLCAVSNCKTRGVWMYLFNRRCLNCAVSQAGKGAAEIERACENGTGSRIYGGANGIVLMSRYPLVDREVVRLPSSGANRVALFARVEVPGKGSVQVGCSHLSAGGPTAPTHPDYDDWEEEKLAQFDRIVAAMRRRANGNPHILMLDANFGPGIGDAVAAHTPELWRHAVAAGYASPMADIVPPVCTSCDDNLTRWSSGNHLIDHVFVHQGTGERRIVPVGASRAIDAAVEVAAYGGTKRLHPSDHYAGVVSFGLVGPWER